MAGSMRRAGFNHSSILAAILEENKIRCTPSLAIREVEAIADSVCRYELGTTTSLDPLTQLRAKAATREPDEAPVLAEHAQLLNTHTLVTTDPDPIDWVWEGFLAPGTLSMLHGEGGLGKSWLAMKIAEQMLTTAGRLFDKPIHPGGVLILDGENAETQIHSRIHYTTIGPNADLAYYMVHNPILGLEEQTELYIKHLVDNHSPRVVIIDSQRALWAGDEKEQAEAGRMLRRFARWIEPLKAAFLFIHHDNRGGDYSGSSDINAAITRPNQVTVAFTALDASRQTITVRGLLARAVMHETDHLNGILLVDRMSQVQKLAIAGKLRRLKQQAKTV
jgi:hypothetical protein